MAYRNTEVSDIKVQGTFRKMTPQLSGMTVPQDKTPGIFLQYLI